jgi:hypothetical protein
MNKCLLIVLYFMYFHFNANCQSSVVSDSIDLDPLSKFHSYTNIAFRAGICRGNTNNIDFIFNKQRLILVKGEFSPTFESNLHMGLLIKPGKIANLFLETGMDFYGQMVNVVNNSAQILQLTEQYFSIPLLIGIRFPMNSMKNGYYYHATGLKIGPYYSFIGSQRLGEINDLDKKFDNPNIIIGKLGVNTEIMISMQNRKGFGHVIGIFTRIDLVQLSSKSEKRPLNISGGLSYYIDNHYK